MAKATRKQVCVDIAMLVCVDSETHFCIVWLCSEGGIATVEAIDVEDQGSKAAK